MRWHVVLTSYGTDRSAGLTIPLLLPPDSAGQDVRVRSHWIGPSGTRAAEPVTREVRAAAPPIDHGREALWLGFEASPGDVVLEVVAELDLTGTLRGDARWLGLPGMATAEVLVRYDLAPDVEGRFQVRGGAGKPLVTRHRGATIIAYREEGIAPRDPESAHVRYATVRADPSGYTQHHATDWGRATKLARRLLVDDVAEAWKGHRAPLVPRGEGASAVAEAFTWVRDRLQRADALGAGYRAVRTLAPAITSNDLTDTDKAVLLAWILTEAKIPFHMAIARSRALPAIDPAFVAPGLFRHVLVFAKDSGSWLDPACQDCLVGQVRPSLRGGQVLLLPADAETPTRLPE